MKAEELDALYDEINKPYSPRELALHSNDRLIKSWLEITHAHNYDLIDLLDLWSNYLAGKGDRPERKLWVMLRPGNNNDNAACARLHDIVKYYAQYDHGKAPRLPIVVFASRSSATLINRLDDFFYSRHITEANHHLKEFFCLISYEGRPKMSRDEFAAKMQKEVDSFISECAQYSVELGEHIREEEAKMATRKEPIQVKIVREQKIPKPVKGKGRHLPFMNLQLQIFKEYLDKHPVCASYSLITRSRQCWFRHKAEWDNAAENKTGYSCYKSLAHAV